MLGVNERVDLKLFGREIIFEEFQPMWSWYLIVTDKQTDREADGWLTVASPCSALASGGKNLSYCKFTGITIFTYLYYCTRTRPVPMKLLPVPIPEGTGTGSPLVRVYPHSPNIYTCSHDSWFGICNTDVLIGIGITDPPLVQMQYRQTGLCI